LSWARRLAVLLTAAGVAFLAFTTTPGTTPVAQAEATHIGLVIDGSASCVDWHSGMTGTDVLRAKASLTFHPTNGLLLQINNQPPSGSPNDNNHFWSYWQNSGGGWVFSNFGPSNNTPRAGTVEGWHYIDGGATTAPPITPSYASLCASMDPQPAPTPPPVPVEPPAATTQAAVPTVAPPIAGGQETSRTSSQTSAGTAAAPAGGETAGSSTQPTDTSETPASVPGTSYSSGRSPSPDPSSTGSDSAIPEITRASSSGNGGSPVGVVLGALAIVAVGGLAAWQVRQRRSRAD
jgi:MYXO-CTERM domain-containing protein